MKYKWIKTHISVMIKHSQKEKHKGVLLWPTFIIYMYKFKFGQSVWDRSSIAIRDLMETH